MKYGALNILPNALAYLLSNMNFVHNILRQKYCAKKIRVAPDAPVIYRRAPARK